MTRLELENLTLAWLSDPNAGYFTRPYVQTLLNNAQKECQKELLQAGQNWYAICATTAITSATPHYTMPSDFRTVQKLELVISGLGTASEASQLLSPMTPIEMTAYSGQQGCPQAYFLKKASLTLGPWPDANYYLKMLYSYMVADMAADSSEPDVPEQYQEYLAVLATLDGINQDDRSPSAFVMTKQEKYRDLMKQDAQQRRQDGPRMVVTTQDDATGWFF